MKSFNEWIRRQKFGIKSPKPGDVDVVEKGMVKFNARPSDHDQWRCNKCGLWNSISRKECSSCKRQHGGERVETRNGLLQKKKEQKMALLRSMIKSLEDSIRELSLGEDMLSNSGFQSFLEILRNQKEALERKLVDFEK